MTRSPGFAAVAGGAAWASAPLVDGLAGRGPAAVVGVAASVLLLVSLAGLRERYPAAWSRAGGGQHGTLVAGGGLGIVGAGCLLRAGALAGPLGFLATPGVAVAVVGLLVAGLGSAVLGYALLRDGTPPTAVALALALGVPASLAVNAVLTALAGVGVGLYGLAWVLVGMDAFGPASPTSEVSPDHRRGRSPGERAD